MKLVFDTHGNDKQKDCCRAWADPSVSEIIYGGSKGCFVAGTLVNTINGLKPIEQIKEGETVLSFNTDKQYPEFKKVLKTFVYGGDTHKSKFITFALRNDLLIKCTANHEFYFEGNWMSADRIAKRILEMGIRYLPEVCYIKHGKTANNELEEFWSICNNETGSRRKRLHENLNTHKFEAQKYIKSQDSSSKLVAESGKQRAGESHKFQSFRQQGCEFGMGDNQRKYASFYQCWQNVRKWLQESLYPQVS